MNMIKKILILTANPKDTKQIRFDQEVREVTECLQRTNALDQFEIHSAWAIQLRDLRRALLDYEPQIVHFCGHGKVAGILIEDLENEAMLAPTEALSSLFELFKQVVELVILNACYTERQAEAIHRHIPYVIGTRHTLPEQTALKFVAGFYDALGAGNSIEDAFQSGQSAIQQARLPEKSAPVLKRPLPPEPIPETPVTVELAIASAETLPEEKTEQTQPSQTDATGKRRKVSSNLRQRIVKLLQTVPNINDVLMQRTLIESAEFDAELKGQITTGVPAAQFSQLLVTTLNDYGELENGKHALEGLLRAIKQFVGQKKRGECNKLIHNLRLRMRTTRKGKVEAVPEIALEMPRSDVPASERANDRSAVMDAERPEGEIPRRSFEMSTVSMPENEAILPAARLNVTPMHSFVSFRHHFICYAADGKAFALQLYDTLKAAGVPVWLDARDAQHDRPDWAMQLLEALRGCESLLFVMTPQSVSASADCAMEWKRALSYKKPIVPLQLDWIAELPLELAGRKPVMFLGIYENAVQSLVQRLAWLRTPEGQLQQLQDRLADAQHAFRRYIDPIQQMRAQQDIDDLRRAIAKQEEVVTHPEAVAKRTQESIARGLERERQPETPVSGAAFSKFINPPPGNAPAYFQDRHMETKIVGDFLQDDSKRVLMIDGRGGIGKTAMVCRLLKALESGLMPDDLGALPVGGIVYLSAIGSRRINVPNLFDDLCKLLPPDAAKDVETLYRDPKVSTTQKIEALTGKLTPQPPLLEREGEQEPPSLSKRGGQGDEFPILLLDNFEDLVNPETRDITDADLNEALRAIIAAPPHSLKAIITTRLAPKALALFRPERYQTLHLDEGLDSPYAENILRAMDKDGKVGLQQADEQLLHKAKERVRGFPRALEALFAILSADRDTTLPELLEGAEGLLPDNVVDVLVGEAFNRLDVPAQHVMQALAIYGRPVTPTAVDYLLEPYLPGVDAAPVLGRLVNMQFARKEAGKYYLHPVDRAYALSRIALNLDINVQSESSGGLKPARQSGQDASASFSFKTGGLPPGTEAYTQPALFHRAAEYFKQTRLPREQWKQLTDLEPQLAEIVLRCAAGEYDTAAEVLTDIDGDYLLLWGYYRLMIELHESLQGKIDDWMFKQLSIARLGMAYESIGKVQKAIKCYEEALVIAREKDDRSNEGALLGNLGNAYADLGQPTRAIEFYEQALAIAREIGDRRGEGNRLGNLGNAYAELGQPARAIEFYEQALAIAIEIGDRRMESILLENLGHVYVDQHEFEKAIQSYQNSIPIADAISFPTVQHNARWGLGLAYLYSNDLSSARNIVETARQYDVPQNKHNVLTLLGIIALRQGDIPAAQEALQAAITHADTLLGYTAQNYDALDAKGLALCGLALCAVSPLLKLREGAGGELTTASPLLNAREGAGGELTLIEQATAAFQQARQIVAAPGIALRVRRLFEALAIADESGLLAGVRTVITTGMAGKQEYDRT